MYARENLWRVRVNIVSMETQSFFPPVIVNVRTYVAVRNIIIVKNLDMKEQKHFCIIFSLKILLQEI
jgi:hypothetical protein